MAKTNKRTVARQRRHARTRKALAGTAERPRLSVFRSNTHLYAQLIDDVAGRTLAAASTLDKDLRGTRGNKEGAAKVGEAIAARAKSAGISEVVFDRGGFKYHGVVRELAEKARENGLKF